MRMRRRGRTVLSFEGKHDWLGAVHPWELMLVLNGLTAVRLSLYAISTQSPMQRYRKHLFKLLNAQSQLMCRR